MYPLSYYVVRVLGVWRQVLRAVRVGQSGESPIQLRWGCKSAVSFWEILRLWTLLCGFRRSGPFLQGCGFRV